MPIISAEIMKTDEREMQKTTKEKQTKTERSKRNRSYSKRVRAKWFCCAFELGFLQLICKAPLTFKSNLDLALSIILKQRELYESRHVAVECRSLKIWDLLSFLICSSILQRLTKYLRLTLVFMWNSTKREEFNLYFSRVFCYIIFNRIFILTGRLGTRLSFYEV